MGFLGYFSTIGLALVAVSLLAAAIAAGLRAARTTAPAPALPDNVIPFPHPDAVLRERVSAAQAFDEAISEARSRRGGFLPPSGGDIPAPASTRTPGFHKGRSYDD